MEGELSRALLARTPVQTPSLLSRAWKTVFYCLAPFVIYGVFLGLKFILANPIVFFSLGALTLVIALIAESVIEHDHLHPPPQPYVQPLIVTHAGDHLNNADQLEEEMVHALGSNEYLLAQRPPNQPKRNNIYVNPSDNLKAAPPSLNIAHAKHVGVEAGSDSSIFQHIQGE
jgi:hypothetical protein